MIRSRNSPGVLLLVLESVEKFLFIQSFLSLSVPETQFDVCHYI